AELLARAQKLCLALFSMAANRMAAAGLILADTKFELGFVDGELVVCDEILTPDSSRIWPADAVVPGETPPSFDKQPFRDWLATLSWDKTPPPPTVPDDVIALTATRYAAAYERVTSRPLNSWFGA
ncbi:MAG: phosphoribosylaminoimidazolesuccinocarboxamide synthase, partial [Actinomycetes bacterium]